MNNADARLIVERRSVDEFVYAGGGFFHGAANHIYFFDRWLVGGLRLHADSTTHGCYWARGFRRGGFDAENIFERDFHAHGPASTSAERPFTRRRITACFMPLTRRRVPSASPSRVSGLAGSGEARGAALR